MTTHSRPLSPHLQVYKPQLTSMMSIVHRATGVVLTIVALPLVMYWLVSLFSGPQTYEEMMGLYGHWTIKWLLVACLFCLFYHLFNGIRHLFWDAGWLLNLKGAYASGWLTIILAVVVTAGVAGGVL